MKNYEEMGKEEQDKICCIYLKSVTSYLREQFSDLVKPLGKPVMQKYRVVKDEKRANNQKIYSVIRDIPELIDLHVEKIYFVEKYEINFRFNKETYGYAWKELGSFKTLEEAKEFLKKIKEEENSKPEVVHEEEF